MLDQVRGIAVTILKRDGSVLYPLLARTIGQLPRYALLARSGRSIDGCILECAEREDPLPHVIHIAITG